MRILHLITSLRIGGAEQALCNYLKAAQESDMIHHVAFFHEGPLLKTIQTLGIATTHLTGSLHQYDPLLFIRLIKLIQSFKPDVIHSSLWSANIIGRICAQFCQIPIVCDLHGKCIHEGFIRNFLDRATYKLAQSQVAVSDEIKNLYITNICSKKNQNNYAGTITVIKNSIDVQAIRHEASLQPLKRQELGLQENDFVIGSIGRLETIKSYDVLIRAFADIQQIADKPLSLCLVGDGSERKNLEQLVINLGLQKRVVFAGMRTDPYRFYPIFDCFALSSQSEGISIALLEALAFGLPIVTTHAHNTHEIITHGINGMLCPINNLALLTKHLATLYVNKSITEKMSNRNYRYAENAFSAKKIASQYYSIFETLKYRKNTLS